ncbi:MAG: hypothetical protein WKF84_23545 [Pyrinomonadaceae bacterium]
MSETFSCDRLTVNASGLLRVLQNDTNPPVITLTQPADSALVNTQSVTVTGTYADESTVTVTINSIAATITGNTFSATVPIAEGVNTLTVQATDASGNQVKRPG